MKPQSAFYQTSAPRKYEESFDSESQGLSSGVGNSVINNDIKEIDADIKMLGNNFMKNVPMGHLNSNLQTLFSHMLNAQQ